MTKKKWYEPELFWCSYCGEAIWIQETPVTQPEQLICDDCLADKSAKKNKDPKDDKCVDRFRDVLC